MTYKQRLIELRPSIWQALLAGSIPAAPNVLPFQSHKVANNAFPPKLSPTSPTRYRRRSNIPWPSIFIGLFMALFTIGGVLLMVFSDPNVKIPGIK
jgi:hypothetical protein